MDDRRARELLRELERRIPGGVLLWRGPALDGSDVDVLLMPGREHEVARVMSDAGLAPWPQHDGRTLWRSFRADAVIIDALPARGWPRHYPSYTGVLARSEFGPDGVRVASVADRLLIRAAEVVAGRSVGHVLRRAQPLLAEPDAIERLHAVAAEEDAVPLARLIAHPDELDAASRRDRLPYRLALRTAPRSPRARAALRARVARRLGFALRAPLPERSSAGSGLLVALSGMDGAGKSTLALELAARLEGAGVPAIVFWSRLASESEILNRIARPVRWVLRRQRPVADPIAIGDGRDDPGARLHADHRRQALVDWLWVILVAAVNALTCRRTARPRRSGLVVICDRWLIDALVDLELRYGGHPVAQWVLRCGIPAADLAIMLEVDPETAARRKPGDHADLVLAAMSRHYHAVVSMLGFPPSAAQAAGGLMRVDARGDRGQVVDRVVAQVFAQLDQRDA